MTGTCVGGGPDWWHGPRTRGICTKGGASMEPAKLPRFRMVVAVDASEHADAVIEFALDQASRHDRPEIHLMCVVDHATDERLKHAHERLASQISTGLETFTPESRDAGWRVRLHVRGGRAAEEIVNLAF